MTTFDWIRLIIVIALIAFVALYGLFSFLPKNNKFFTTKTIAASGVLTAVEIALQIVGNFITIGPVSINLSLIPIALGAILYGPLCGAFLGFINGLTVVIAPSTLAIFMPINPIATVFLCILKSTLAGLFAGLIYLPFKKKYQTIGSIIAAMSVPVINTGLFAIGSMLFFQPFLNGVATSLGFSNIYTALFLAVIGWNFIFEFIANSLISPALSRVVTVVNKRRNVAYE